MNVTNTVRWHWNKTAVLLDCLVCPSGFTVCCFELFFYWKSHVYNLADFAAVKQGYSEWPTNALKTASSFTYTVQKKSQICRVCLGLFSPTFITLPFTFSRKLTTGYCFCRQPVFCIYELLKVSHLNCCILGLEGKIIIKKNYSLCKSLMVLCYFFGPVCTASTHTCHHL